MTINDRIRDSREKQRMTLEEVAKIVGVGKPTILKYETGAITNIPSDKIELLAKAFDVTPAYLMGWEDEQKNSSDPKAAAIEKLSKVASQLSPEHIELLTQHAQFLQGSQKGK